MKREQHTNVLYRFFNASDQLLYIGITMNPPARFSSHSADKDWWTEVAKITIEGFSSRDQLVEAERNAIKEEKPHYNIVYNNARRMLRSSAEKPQHKLLVKSPLAPRTRLVGMFFHSWKEATDPEYEIIRNGRAVGLQGRIINEIAPQTFLVEQYSWWDGCVYETRLVELLEMTQWTFYETNIDMMANTGCGEFIWDNSHQSRGRCGKTVVGIAGLEYGLTSAVCTSCSKHYSEVWSIEDAKKEVKKGDFYIDTANGEKHWI